MTLESNHPSSIHKKILYSVLGLSPQILTETLYALAKETPPFIPDEVHVLTTQKGAKMCKLALFQENGGWFHKLCQDLNITGTQFTEKNIHTITNLEAVTIDDIRTKEDNASVANQITRQIRFFTQDPDTQLHVSIAGGRKTMGFYAGYALSIFGRPQDQLSHVLVDSAFESHPAFFYPTPYSSVIRSRDGNDLLDRKDANVELAYMPFIAMRQAIPEKFLDVDTTFEGMVQHLQKNVFDIKVLISVVNNKLIIGDTQIKLSPANFVFYYWLAKRVELNLGAIELPHENEPDLDYRDEYLECIKECIDEMTDMDRTLAAIQNGIDRDFIRDRKNQIKKALESELGMSADVYFIHLLDRKKRLHGLKLTTEQVRFI